MSAAARLTSTAAIFPSLPNGLPSPSPPNDTLPGRNEIGTPISQSCGERCGGPTSTPAPQLFATQEAMSRSSLVPSSLAAQSITPVSLHHGSAAHFRRPSGMAITPAVSYTDLFGITDGKPFGRTAGRPLSGQLKWPGQAKKFLLMHLRLVRRTRRAAFTQEGALRSAASWRAEMPVTGQRVRGLAGSM